MNTSDQSGNHWYVIIGTEVIEFYFDSYCQITPVEIQRYLEAVSEFDRGKEVIQRNTYIEQAVNTSVCGHLCLCL